MKKLLILLFSTLISFNSYGQWLHAGDLSEGDKVYMDFTTIKKNNGYVYHWELMDFLKPTKNGDFSATVYYETNCNIPVKSRMISINYYKRQMGQGYSRTDNTTYEWHYSAPGSVAENNLRMVCKWKPLDLD
jgi:hypothetical protein